MPRAFRMRVGVGGSLGDEGEGAVGVNRDNDRDLKTSLILGTLVEFLDELGNVDAVLAESRADRGRRSCLCSRDLQLDITCYFLCHDKHLLNKCGDTRARAYIWRGSSPSHVPRSCGVSR